MTDEEIDAVVAAYRTQGDEWRMCNSADDIVALAAECKRRGNAVCPTCDQPDEPHRVTLMLTDRCDADLLAEIKANRHEYRVMATLDTGIRVFLDPAFASGGTPDGGLRLRYTWVVPKDMRKLSVVAIQTDFRGVVRTACRQAVSAGVLLDTNVVYRVSDALPIPLSRFSVFGASVTIDPIKEAVAS